MLSVRAVRLESGFPVFVQHRSVTAENGTPATCSLFSESVSVFNSYDRPEYTRLPVWLTGPLRSVTNLHILEEEAEEEEEEEAEEEELFMEPGELTKAYRCAHLPLSWC